MRQALLATKRSPTADGHATVTYTASKFNVQCWVLATEADGGKGSESIIYQGTDVKYSPTLVARFPATLHPGGSATFSMTATNPSVHPLYNAQVYFVIYPGSSTKKIINADQVHLSYSTHGPGGHFAKVHLTGSTAAGNDVEGYVGSALGATMSAHSTQDITFRVTLAGNVPTSGKVPLDGLRGLPQPDQFGGWGWRHSGRHARSRHHSALDADWAREGPVQQAHKRSGATALPENQPRTAPGTATMCGARLPPRAPFPILLGSWRADNWEVLLFEDVGGANPALPWHEDQLDRVLAALQAMSAGLTPSPIAAPAASNPGGSHHWRDSMPGAGPPQTPSAMGAMAGRPGSGPRRTGGGHRRRLCRRNPVALGSAGRQHPPRRDRGLFRRLAPRARRRSMGRPRLLSP